MNYLFLVLNVLCWSIVPIMIKWLGSYFDIHTQNFYRYLAAGIFLFILARSIYPVSWSGAVKRLKTFLLPAVFMVTTQVLWVAGIYRSNASLAVILGKMDLIFIILFSYFIFRDEREVIRSARFKIAVIIIFIGMVGVVLGQSREMVLEMGLGMLLIFLACISWALYTISVKIATNNVIPLISSSLVVALATVFLFPVALTLGNLKGLSEIPLQGIMVLLASGILGVGIGQVLFYLNVKNVGTVITSSFILSTPILSLIFAYFILGEKLTLIQILSGLLILAGCYIILPLVRKIPYRVK